jgi:hypothetical protein
MFDKSVERRASKSGSPLEPMALRRPTTWIAALMAPVDSKEDFYESTVLRQWRASHYPSG